MCGPASIKALAAHYGVDVDEDRVKQIASSTKRDGTPIDNMVDALRRLGFAVTSRDDATYSQLRSALEAGPVIVDWFSTDDGHYSVVTKATEDEVVMMDPERGKKRTMPRDEFERVWFDFSTDPGQEAPDGQLRRHVFIQVKPPQRS